MSRVKSLTNLLFTMYSLYSFNPNNSQVLGLKGTYRPDEPSWIL